MEGNIWLRRERRQKRSELIVKRRVKWRWEKTGGKREAAQKIVKRDVKNRAEGWRGQRWVRKKGR